MSMDIGTVGTVYHCNIDGGTYRVTGDNTAERVTDPATIAAAQDKFISNWRQFHLTGDNSGRPAGGDTPPPISTFVANPPQAFVKVPSDYQDGSGEQNMQEAMRRLMGPPYNLTKEQAAAFIGNWMHESGGVADINQGGARGGPNGDMNGSGYGFAQWTGVRKQKLLDFCAQNNLDPSKFDSQWQYLQTEPEFQQALEGARRAGSIDAATAAVEVALEGIPLDYDPAVLAMASRQEFARQAAAS